MMWCVFPEIAKDMVNQMKSLGYYHGHSGYLRPFKGNGAAETENDDAESDVHGAAEIAKHVSFNNHRRHSHSPRLSGTVLEETQGLRQKLENISLSINKIRENLHKDSSVSGKELNETMLSFQEQLTEIQDQIEDAENDIESNIDLKLIKYQEDIKSHKQRIKAMKKEKKD